MISTVDILILLIFGVDYRINHLEICHQLDWQDGKSTKISLAQNYIDTPTKSLINQANLNTIYISQPIVELKYCGVSYLTRDIFSMNKNLVQIHF